jgi:hypothetical protein
MKFIRKKCRLLNNPLFRVIAAAAAAVVEDRKAHRAFCGAARSALFLLLLAGAMNALPVQAQSRGDEPVPRLADNLSEKPAADSVGQTVPIASSREIKFPSLFKPKTAEKARFDFKPQKNAGDDQHGEKGEKPLPPWATGRDDAKKFPASQTSGGYVRPNAKQRFNNYLSGVVGPYALLGTAAFAGVYHYRDLPQEWENDSRGYARRFASGLGIQAVRATTIYALDEAFRLDSNFYKSKRKKISERLADAVVSTYTARKPDGRRVFGFPRIAGNYAAMTVAYKTWYPERFGFKQAARDTVFSLGFDVGINIFREFFPWGK